MRAPVHNAMTQRAFCYAALGSNCAALASFCAARHAAASSKVTYRREPTAISRGASLSFLSLKYIAIEMRCAAQKSLIEYQAAGTGGPRTSGTLLFAFESGSLLIVGSIAIVSATG